MLDRAVDAVCIASHTEIKDGEIDSEVLFRHTGARTWADFMAQCPVRAKYLHKLK